jgi:hypothetical protein
VLCNAVNEVPPRSAIRAEMPQNREECCMARTDEGCPCDDHCTWGYAAAHTEQGGSRYTLHFYLQFADAIRTLK